MRLSLKINLSCTGLITIDEWNIFFENLDPSLANPKDIEITRTMNFNDE